MKLPRVENPLRYQDLYVFDFGEWSSLGYTAEEIAILLESEDFRDGKVYRILRAAPDGSMELQGVSPQRFQVESAMVFFRADREAAELDFDELCDAAERTPPPGRAAVRLLDRSPEALRTRYATALLYPAELDPAVSRWLTAIGYNGGDTVEGGISAAAHIREDSNTILKRQQLWSATSAQSRSREQVLASVRRAVQR